MKAEAEIFLSNLGNVGLIELVRCARHFTIWEHSVVIGLQEVDKLVDKRLKVSFIVSADVGQSSSKNDDTKKCCYCGTILNHFCSFRFDMFRQLSCINDAGVLVDDLPFHRGIELLEHF